MKKGILLIITILMVTMACTSEMHQVPPMATDDQVSNTDIIDAPKMFEVMEEEVDYFDGVKGFHVRPTAERIFPGVVMIHEWWGLNDNIKEMARKLAAEGYEVLAVDIYEGDVATTGDEARALMGKVNQERANQNMKAAKQFLQSKGVQRFASLGWCFGGAQSLQLSLAEPMDATVIYYGRLVDDPEQLKVLNGPVLGLFAERDQGIPPSAVQSFESALNEAGIGNDITIYQGVDHAFANPSGERYAPDETKDAWSKTVAFLKANLG